MPRIFWIVCPSCGTKFYARYEDFRGTKRQLLCPNCTHRFTDDEAREIIE